MTPAHLEKLFRHDIRRDFYLGKFDVVVCCNVLLYFTPAVKAWVMARLAAALRRGGFLFLGHAEGVTPATDLFRPRQHPVGAVYQRI